jgi:hypothetical protein
MSPYSEILRIVNSASTPQRPARQVTGQYVAKAHLGRRQRAALAAGLANGSVTIFPLTVRQAATLVQVPVLDVTRARRANGNGHANGNGKPDGETLAQHLARSTPAELQEAARTVGVDAIWDRMISPIIATERTAAE